MTSQFSVSVQNTVEWAVNTKPELIVEKTINNQTAAGYVIPITIHIFVPQETVMRPILSLFWPQEAALTPKLLPFSF